MGGLLFANGMVAIVGNHFYKGVLDYTTIIGGAAMIFTAVRQPAGIAPTFQPLVQHFGRWLVRARGREWATALRRVAPGALLAMIPVVLLLWTKAGEFRNWFLLQVPLTALFIRGIALEIINGVKGLWFYTGSGQKERGNDIAVCWALIDTTGSKMVTS